MSPQLVGYRDIFFPELRKDGIDILNKPYKREPVLTSVDRFGKHWVFRKKQSHVAPADAAIPFAEHPLIGKGKPVTVIVQCLP
jgi:hypothetical protein